MDLFISAFILFIIDSMIFTPTSTKHVCHYYYCELRCDCYHFHCYENVSCGQETTITIRNVLYGNENYWFDYNECQYNCKGDVEYNNTYTNEIAELYNGQQMCSLSHWNSGSNWNLDIDYFCQAVTVPRTSPTIPTRTGTITYESETTTDSETTSTKSNDASSTQTSSTTPGNDSINTTESKTDNSSSSDKFPVTAVASSVTAVSVVVFIVLVGIVCIKLRKANKENTDSTRVQFNGSLITTTQAVTNRDYDETNTADRGTEPREYSEQDYEYAADLVAINTTNENEYNTLNETAKPIKASPNYDHIPKQLTSVNKTSITTNDEIYNTLNDNAICKGLNNDPNYDNVSKQAPPEDQTYSHIMGGKSVINQSNYQVHDTGMYSHLKQ